MIHFVALSSASSRVSEIARLTDRAERSLARMSAGRVPSRATHPSGSLLYDQQPHDQHATTPNGARLWLCETSAYSDVQGRRFSAAELLATLQASGRDFTQEMSPPFGCLFMRSSQDPPVVLVDRQGLRHLYKWQGDGIAIVATSPILIAATADLGLDSRAIGEYAWMGHYLGTRTLIKGVTKLSPSEAIELVEGNLRSQTTAEPVAQAPESPTARAGAAILRRSVEAMVETYPDAVLELSGGLDSRIVLASLSTERRAGLRALTLGTFNSSDVAVASQIAQRYELDQQWLDLGSVESIGVDRAWELLADASTRHAHMANPFEKGVLEFVRRSVEVAPRLSGMNGEFARGFYYPGQALDSTTSPAAVARLVAWRLTTNDAARGSALSRDFLEDSRARVEQSVQELFEAYPQKWGRALDELYVDSRMHRWAGIACSVAGSERPTLVPFFDREFLEWSRSLDPVQKQNSHMMSAMLAELDADLARLPLDTGLAPEIWVRNNPVAKMKRHWYTSVRVASKIAQRLLRVGKPGIGANTFMGIVASDRTRLLDELSPLASSPWTAAGELERLGSDGAVDTATLGLLLNLSWAVREIDDLRAETMGGSTVETKNSP